MIDYISAESFIDCKVKPNFSNCELDATFSKSGWQRFFINGCKKLQLDWNEEIRLLRLSGSIIYYWQGHNISFENEGFYNAIEYIKRTTNIPLWNFKLNTFEYGKILRVQNNPKDYIKHHYINNSSKLQLYENSKDKGRLRGWENKEVRLKMYDARINFLTKAEIDKKDVLESLGYSNGNLLKWEVHYKKPEIFNEGVSLNICDLLNPSFKKMFENDLFNQYKKLIPMKSYLEPTNKKDLSTSDILILEILQLNYDSGESAEKVKKSLYSRVNSFPDEILSKSDKDARKRQIKVLIDKVQESTISKWDLSEAITEVIEKFR